MHYAKYKVSNNIKVKNPELLINKTNVISAHKTNLKDQPVSIYEGSFFV
jgi:hypothetical protein